MAGRGRLYGALCAAIFGASAASAEPAPVGASDEAVRAFRPPPADLHTFQRPFYFHKDGVPIELARADILECRDYAAKAVLWARIPDRVPVAEKAVKPEATGSGIISPLAAGVVLSLFGGAEQRKIAAANLRKCMGFKGYRRYALSEPLWEWLNRGEAAEILDRQARIASGSAPAAPWLDP